VGRAETSRAKAPIRFAWEAHFSGESALADNYGCDGEARRSTVDAVSTRPYQAALAAIAGVLISASSAAAAAPDTKITSGPSGPLASKSATFKFKATVSGATFQCKIDTKDWASCDSPKKYTKLKQGDHAFQVRARKRHAVDRTPATRSFTVDTIAPDTTVYGPQDAMSPYVNGYTEDQTPESTFFSTEPGTFRCRITSAISSPPFEPCESPFTPSSPLPRDAFYTVEAKAVDEAGNVDPTPGSDDFDVETPITEDQQTVALAAAMYFPDAANRDAPASCGGSTPIDCPGGNALPPDDDQLSTASGRNVVAGPQNSHRYDLTVTHDSHTISPVVVTSQGIGDCDLTFNSANGATAHWTITQSLTFETGNYISGAPGGKLIAPQNVTVSGIDSQDYAIAPHNNNLACSFAGSFLPASSFAGAYIGIIGADEALCAKLGPGYLAPCSESNLAG
jgi:hypothetical protein